MDRGSAAGPRPGGLLDPGNLVAARYSGPRSRYPVTQSADGSVTVTDTTSRLLRRVWW